MSVSFKIVNSTPDMVHRLVEIQNACFPGLSTDHRLTEEHYLSHINVFPEGQFAVVSSSGEPVASSTDLRVNIDTDHFQHRYMEMIGNNWLTTHNPAGEWLYGADIGVHPDYRGLGLSRKLYDARKDLVRDLNLRGHILGGLFRGYGSYKMDMSIEDYARAVSNKTIFDPTVSVQLRRGFTMKGIIYDYLDDSGCDNKAAFLIWHNPDYKE